MKTLRFVWFALAATVVVGQQNFTTAIPGTGGPGYPLNAKSLDGPQAVWIQNGKLEAIRPDGTRAYRIRATAVQELLGDPVVAQHEESDGTFSSANIAERFVVPAGIDEQATVQ